MLAELALVEQSRETMTAAILDAVDEHFGPRAGIHLTRPLPLSRPAGRGMRTLAVGEFGTIIVPRSASGSSFVRVLAARLADFEALETARGRAARLDSLYQAAHEFAAELDLDRTLNLIVQRGKALTGADICYLSMNDFERGETYIRTTAGAKTDAFTQIRLRYGDGLGGLVAKEGKPYYSADYLNDTRFVHVVDREVAIEGMVSVMGVPLKLGRRVIGVLFVGNRRRSVFRADEVAFLEALGDHAAVAIENARLYGRLDRAARLHRGLTDLVLTEQPIEALESEIGAVIGLPVRVLRCGSTAESPGGIRRPVLAGSALLGQLWVGAATLDEEQHIALEQAAHVVAVHLLKEKAVMQATLRSRSELLEAMLSGTMPAQELAQRASAYGINMQVAHRAMVLPGDQTAALSREMPEAFIAGRLGNTVALVPDGVSLPQRRLAALGPSAIGLAALTDSIHEATRVLDVAAMLSRTGVVTRHDLGVYSLLLYPDSSGDLQTHARSLLGPLIAYDKVHGDVLVPTLEAFLDAQCRPREAARKLHLHTNSMYYRLSRIKALTAWDLDDAELRLQLHISCRLLRLSAGKIP